MPRILLCSAALSIASLAVIAPLGCSGASGDGGGSRRHFQSATCISYKESQETTAAAEARNEQAFRKAVADKGLEIVPIKGYTVDKPHESFEPVWSVKTDEGPTGRILIGPRDFHACAGPDPSWLVFARNDSGHLVALARRPQRSFERFLLICGCEADAPARGCGVAPQPVQWYFPLPEGMTFEKEVEISYPVESMREEFAGRGDTPCPEPIPLP